MRLGWVDFSREDRERTLDVMNLLQEQGAVDEIGIGQVRDAFANIFFPGTSTIQTIAKYFLIVPYVLKEATEGRYGSDPDEILRRIDEEERDCAVRLIQNCPGEDGIIGKRVLPDRWVARKPSNIYWNGIRAYGICRQNLTMPELLRESAALRSQRRSASLGNRGDDDPDSERDDLDAGGGTAMQFFSVPDDYYSDWRGNLSVLLTRSEAAFLRGAIETAAGASLMGYLLKNNIDLSRYDSFEAIYEDLGGAVPEELGKTMKLACDFNRLVYAARVRYNHIFSDGRNEAAVEEWAYVEENMARMTSVDIDDVLDTLQISNFRLRRFLTSFRAALLWGDLDAADRAVIDREVEIKTRSRAKLCKRGGYTDGVWIGGRYLDYRFFSAKRIITDIYRAEEADHV